MKSIIDIRIKDNNNFITFSKVKIIKFWYIVE